MKTKTIKLLTFDELTDEQKEKVLENYWDINLDYEWWFFQYELAKEINMVIKEFNIDRADYCKSEFNISGIDTAELILKNPDLDKTDMYNHANDYKTEYDKIQGMFTENDPDFNDGLYDSLNELEREFLDELENDFLVLLKNEYEWRGGEEQIIETIKINEYTFNEETLKIDS